MSPEGGVALPAAGWGTMMHGDDELVILSFGFANFPVGIVYNRVKCGFTISKGGNKWSARFEYLPAEI